MEEEEEDEEQAAAAVLSQSSSPSSPASSTSSPPSAESPPAPRLITALPLSPSSSPPSLTVGRSASSDRLRAATFRHAHTSGSTSLQASMPASAATISTSSSTSSLSSTSSSSEWSSPQALVSTSQPPPSPPSLPLSQPSPSGAFPSPTSVSERLCHPVSMSSSLEDSPAGESQRLPSATILSAVDPSRSSLPSRVARCAGPLRAAPIVCAELYACHHTCGCLYGQRYTSKHKCNVRMHEARGHHHCYAQCPGWAMQTEQAAGKRRREPPSLVVTEGGNTAGAEGPATRVFKAPASGSIIDLTDEADSETPPPSSTAA